MVMTCRPFQVASTSRCAAHETCGQFTSCIAVGPAVSVAWSPSPAATINPRSTSVRIIFKHSYMTLADLHSVFFSNSASLQRLSGCSRTQKPGKIRDRNCPSEPKKSLMGHSDAILLSRISEDGVFQQPPFFSQTLRSPRRSSGCRRTKQGTRRQGAAHRYKTETARQAQNERFGLPSPLPGLQVCSSRACDDKAGRIVRRSSSVSLFRNRSWIGMPAALKIQPAPFGMTEPTQRSNSEAGTGETSVFRCWPSVWVSGPRQDRIASFSQASLRHGWPVWPSPRPCTSSP